MLIEWGAIRCADPLLLGKYREVGMLTFLAQESASRVNESQ